MNTGHSVDDLGNHHVLSHSNKDYHCAMDSGANISVVFLMVKKIKTKVKRTAEEGDDPDYRYWDFRDEIVDVEKMRTIGGNYGKKEKEKSKEKPA